MNAYPTQGQGWAPPPPPKKTATRWWLVLLVVFGVFFLGVAGLGAAGYFWFAANKDQIVENGKKALLDADTYATSHDQSQCVDRALEVVSACHGVMCEAETKVFLSRCLQRATPTPSLCTDVPKATDFLKAASWMTQECKRRGRKGNDQVCARLVGAIPQVCATQGSP